MKIRDLCEMAICLAIIIICSKISFNIGPVPITLQTLAVSLCAAVLGYKRAMLTIILYIIMGLIGVPVFSTGGGYQYILTPTFGFILGFIFLSFFAGITRFNKYIWPNILLSMLGLLIADLIGIIYFAIVSNGFNDKGYSLTQILTFTFTPFILKDSICVVFASLLGIRLRQIIYKENLKKVDKNEEKMPKF
jgi:biotin transport system substrate-specific component